MITSQVEHAAVHTQDVTMARDRVTDLFCAHGLEPRRGLDLHVDARRVGAEGHRVGLVDMDYGSTVRITPEPLESFYLVQIPSAARPACTTKPQRCIRTRRRPPSCLLAPGPR